MDKLANSCIQLKKELIEMRRTDIKKVIMILESKYNFKEDYDVFIESFMLSEEEPKYIYNEDIFEDIEPTCFSDKDHIPKLTNISTNASIKPDIMPKINYLKCRGKTQSGDQCSRNIKNSTLYCGSHMVKRPHGSFPL